MRKLSKASFLLLGLAAAAAVGAALTVQLHRAPPHALDSEIFQLETELASLAKATPANAKRARDFLREADRSLWTEDRLASWAATLPEGWVIHELGSPDTKSVTLRRFSIERTQASFDHWPEIRGMIEQLATVPGLTIRTLTVTPDARPSRNFRKVLLIATIAFPLPGAASAAPAPNPSAASTTSL